jgi:CRP-like cAMP-binding protein
MDIRNLSESLLRLKKKLTSFAPLSDKEFMLWANMMHEKQYNKGEVMLKEGQVCKHFYFILDGYLRSFSLEEGREVNVKFYFEDDFACDFESFRNASPSLFYMVAMEDVTVYYTTKQEAIPILESEQGFFVFLFRFFQDLYLKEEEHSNSFKLLSPEQRYRYLIEHKPQYLQRIPLIHLASYLGMSRETLTRIRKKIS